MPNFVANWHALVLAELDVESVPFGENWDITDQADGCSFIFNATLALALDRTKLMDLGAINQAILDGGYDPPIVYVRLHGCIELQDDSVLLTCNSNGQTWRLVGDSVATNAKEVVVEGRNAFGAVSADLTSRLIPVTVTKVEERQ